MEDLDNAVNSLEAWEAKERQQAGRVQEAGRVPVGSVERFFDRIGVAAIKLTAGLKVGDLIEIGNEDEAVRQRVSSMQIDRVDVEEASEGDSVGIKTNHPVPAGSLVYKIEK